MSAYERREIIEASEQVWASTGRGGNYGGMLRIHKILFFYKTDRYESFSVDAATIE